MNDLGLVSIVMPSYNTEKYIKESINSVLLQTYTNWELIIVDDCSKDNTEEVVKSYNDNRIRFFKNEKNRGAALSRNKALREAKGEWIAFLDSDDLWRTQKLEKQLNFMVKNNYNFSYTNYNEIDESSSYNGILVSGPKVISKIGMHCYCWPGCLTIMYNSNYVGIIQIPDIKKNNDYSMWIEVVKKTKCFLLNENLAQYRKRSGSISNKSYLSLIKWHYKLFKENKNMNVGISILLTFVNIIFGIIKKIIYIKHGKNDYFEEII